GQSVEQKADAAAISAAPNSFQEEEAHYACGLAVTLKIADASADSKKQATNADANKMVCHSEAVLGSTIPIRRCETRLQRDERRRADRESVARGQAVERITESA